MEYGRRIGVLAFLLFMSFAAAVQSEGENAVPYKSSNKSVFGWEKSSSHAQPEKERAYMLPPSGTKFEFSAYRTKWRLF